MCVTEKYACTEFCAAGSEFEKAECCSEPYFQTLNKQRLEAQPFKSMEEQNF